MLCENSRADVWSVGCTVVEMTSGLPPWGLDMNPFQALVIIANTDRIPTIPSSLSSDAADFVRLCLTRDTEKRPDVITLMQHPWMKLHH